MGAFIAVLMFILTMHGPAAVDGPVEATDAFTKYGAQ